MGYLSEGVPRVGRARTPPNLKGRHASSTHIHLVPEQHLKYIFYDSNNLTQLSYFTKFSLLLHAAMNFLKFKISAHTHLPKTGNRLFCGVLSWPQIMLQIIANHSLLKKIRNKSCAECFMNYT